MGNRQQAMGNSQCSDGTLLADTMRCANAIVDQLAKQAAESIAMPPGMRASLKQRCTQAEELAIFVGQLTFAAGHCDRGDGQHCRDSVGTGAAIAKRRLIPQARKAKAMSQRVAAGAMAPQALEETSEKVAGVLQRIRRKWTTTLRPSSI